MKILITGSSSGIGYEFAKKLDEKNNELILVARSKEKLEKLKKELKAKVNIEIMDLSIKENVYIINIKIK